MVGWGCGGWGCGTNVSDIDCESTVGLVTAFVPDIAVTSPGVGEWALRSRREVPVTVFVPDVVMEVDEACLGRLNCLSTVAGLVNLVREASAMTNPIVLIFLGPKA